MYVVRFFVFLSFASQIAARLPSTRDTQSIGRSVLIQDGEHALEDQGSKVEDDLLLDFSASQEEEVNRFFAELTPFIFKVEQVSSNNQPAQYPRHGPLSQQYARLPFAQEHIHMAPKPFRYIIIPIAGLSFLVTFLISGRLVLAHFAEGERRRVEERKVFRPKITTSIIYVVLLFPVISFMSFMSCVAPRNTVLLLVVARSYEAIAMFAFFELLVCMMGDPEEAVTQMEQQEPFKIYGMPPLFCFYPCVPKMTMNRDRFIIARNLVLQYCFFGPLTYLSHAWNNGYVPWFGSREPKQWVARHLVGHGAKLLSTLLCFWGLFQLYKATHFRLHELETTKKFALIKIMLILCEAINLAMYVAKKFYDFSDDPVYNEEVMVNAWIQMATCVLIVPLACCLPSAFPVADLEFLDSEKRLWSSPSSYLPESKPLKPPQQVQIVC